MKNTDFLIFLSSVFNKYISVEDITNNSLFEDKSIIRQTIYSLGALHGLYALFDKLVDNYDSQNNDYEYNPCTVNHLKSRINKVFSALDLFCKENTNYDSNSINYESDDQQKGLADYIFTLYKSTGFFYSIPKNLFDSSFKSASIAGIKFIRGNYFSQNLKMCGAGPYEIDLTPEINSIESVKEFFHLPLLSCKDAFEQFLYTLDFRTSAPINSNTEYLNASVIKNNTFNSYWVHKKSINKYTLARIKNSTENNFDYYLIRNLCGNEEYAKLKSTHCKNKNYIFIARAIHEMNNQLPPIEYKTDEVFTYINIGYLLPTEIQNFFELYSWPSNERINSFSRIMTTPVFVAFKKVLESLDFKFSEV